MGRKTIYVSAVDDALFAEAAALAGGSLSSAIRAGLKLYVTRRRGTSRRCREIEVPVGSGRAKVFQRFEGWVINEFGAPADEVGRIGGVTVYGTRGGRLAGWWYSDPDYRALREVPGLLDDPDPDNPEALDEWFDRRGVALRVADDADGLCDALGLDDETRAALRQSHSPREVEELDI